MIKELNREHIRQVASIHKRELSGFLPELGIEFLELFYTTSLSMPEMFTYVEEEKGEIKGLVTGVTQTKNLYFKIISRQPIRFVVIFLKYFITHFNHLIKFYKILTYPGFSEGGAELLSIAVSNQFQKRGIGKKLFQKTADEFKRRGIGKFKISVYDRLTANGFYIKIGCRLVSSFIFLDERMNYYSFKIQI